MEIKDKVEVTNSELYVSGTPREAMNIYTSVKDRPISQLLTKLKSEGIIISQEDSEKIIKYEINKVGEERAEKTSALPLEISVDDGKYLTGHVLRNENLKININDFFDSDYTGMPGCYGGDSKVTTGVVVDIFYQGVDDFNISKLKKIITEFYKPKPRPFKTSKKIKKQVKVTDLRKAKSKK